ncbi:Uncharacterized protein TPAR_06180 [Tolypocladium paradoxum]|uniref:GPI anchored serine-rich protein n=1 Tax=Tolypocladium paradoxum TaxID=94208 RepID=A0A2S4KTV9_9HYPO|nr:Uncharacterized protein TPAR_06180 [Tolypocladium paradoxum]
MAPPQRQHDTIGEVARDPSKPPPTSPWIGIPGVASRRAISRGKRQRRRACAHQERRRCFQLRINILPSSAQPPLVSSLFLPSQPNKPTHQHALTSVVHSFNNPPAGSPSSSLYPPSVLHEPPTVFKMRFSTVALMAGSALAADVSTDYTTQMVTITACPASVTNCPAKSMTSSVITSVVPLTTSTVYSTKVHTITSCAPTVTKCPAHSTVISTETIAVSTTVCPVVPTSYWSNSTAVPTGPCGGKPCPPATTSVVVPSGTVVRPTTQAPVCPGTTVTAITKSYTTVLTSVEYSTIQVPCPTVSTKGPSGTPSGTVTRPAVTPPPAVNTTKPGNPPPVTAGAASFAGSALFAAAAGVAAFVFA